MQWCIQRQRYALPLFLCCFSWLSLNRLFRSGIVQNIAATESSQNAKQIISTSSSLAHQRIVILPGPHKTGSTSIQNDLYRWLAIPSLNESATPSQQGMDPFDEWAFPIPTQHEITQAVRYNASRRVISQAPLFYEAKTFATLAFQLWMAPPDHDISQNLLYQLFQQEFEASWDHGYNLVIASEELDHFSLETANGEYVYTDARTPPVTPDLVWQRLLASLPTSIQRHPEENIVIGIVHRTPRINHLISLWHEFSKTEQALLDFVTKPASNGLKSLAPVLNSMGLADYFVQKGYSVVILDSGGSQVAGVDLFVATACHILQVPCREVKGKGLELVFHNIENQTTANNSTTTSDEQVLMTEGGLHMNQRADNGTRAIEPVLLEEMNRLMMEYDCQFQYLAHMGDRVRLLYANDTFSGCPLPPRTTRKFKHRGKATGRPKITFSETIQAMIGLVCHHYPESQHCSGSDA